MALKRLIRSRERRSICHRR